MTVLSNSLMEYLTMKDPSWRLSSGESLLPSTSAPRHSAGARVKEKTEQKPEGPDPANGVHR